MRCLGRLTDPTTTTAPHRSRRLRRHRRTDRWRPPALGGLYAPRTTTLSTCLGRSTIAKTKQKPRECESCGHRWWAEPAAKPRKPSRATGNMYELGGWSGAAQKSMQRALATYQENLRRWEQWAMCPACGSDKIEMPREKGFVPTAASMTSRQGGPRLTCHCGAATSPAWNYCPMCAAPVVTDPPSTGQGPAGTEHRDNRASRTKRRSSESYSHLPSPKRRRGS